MKKNLIIMFILFSIFIVSTTLDANDNLSRYSGSNLKGFIDLLSTQQGDTLRYVKFLLDNISPNDMAALTPEYLLKNVELAIMTKKLPYAEYYDENIFLHFVLPHRVSQEPLENWREQFYDEIYPLVKDEKDIEKASIIVNLWAAEKMMFKQTHGRDQGPITTIKRGYGRCEETMIIVIAALRAVGIPARTASAPYWNFTDSNHAWVEIWTPDGWKYTGEPENSLNRAWFTKTTERSTLIQSHAFGNFSSPTVIKQKDNVTTISSIQYYTDYTDCKISVYDNNQPVENANVIIYATSFGGLFPLQTLETDSSGEISLPLGNGSVWATAYKGGKFASKKFDLMNKTELSLNLSGNLDLDENFSFYFPLSHNQTPRSFSQELLGDKFYMMRDLANLKRKERLNSQKHASKFVKYYDEKNGYKLDDDYNVNRENFLDKCDELAANTDDFLFCLELAKSDIERKVLIDMIENWDIKELCEIPDSTTITQVAEVYSSSKNFYSTSIPDSVFSQNVIGATWRSATPPQNGWQPELFELLSPMRNPNITQTVESVLNWIDQTTVIDEGYTWSYFSGAMNPLDIINLKNIPQTYRVRLINSSLKTLGIPVCWKGRLEYFDGNKFIKIPRQEEEIEIEDYASQLRIKIFVDNIQVKADPFSNFLLAQLDEESGMIYNTYFDGKDENLDYVATYRSNGEDYIYIESFIRNSNGDSDIRIKRINDLIEVKIDLTTPKEFIDSSEKWSEITLKNCLNQLPKDDSKYHLLFVRGQNSNEPEIRILDQLNAELEQLQNLNCSFTIYSENRKNPKKRNNVINYQSGEKIISDQIEAENYPVIFLFEDQQNLIFSSIGYDMGLSKLIFSKIK